MAAANTISASLNGSNSSNGTNASTNLLNNTNQTGNGTNQTISNATRDALIHNATLQMQDISNYANGTNLTVIAEYSGQNLEKLKKDINNSNMNNQTKKKILLNVNLAIQTNNQSINALISGNTALGQSKIQYEKTVLNTIKTQIATEKGKTIDASLADNLTQTVNTIQTGQNNGGQWILNNTGHFNFTSTHKFYENLENKTAAFKNTIQQLKDGGVPMDIRSVDASDLQSNGDGTFSLKNSTNTTSNGTVKAKAVLPVLVIFFAAGVVIEINNAVMAALSTDVAIEYILKTHPGDIVCGDCRFRMYALNLFGLTAGTIATWGISIYAMDTIILLRYGLAMINYASFINDFSGQVLSTVFIRTDALVSDGCHTPRCVFFKDKKRDLVGALQVPNKGNLNRNNTITTTISNTKYGNTSSFKVTLYENSSSNGTPDYTPIATQTVSMLSGKNETTVSFNWIPTYLGDHRLKVVVDSDHEINETNEDNNDEYATVNVDYPTSNLELYDFIPHLKSPGVIHCASYYFRADHPIHLDRNKPTYLFNTTPPEYGGGFQSGINGYGEYGSIWVYCSQTPDVNGSWTLVGNCGIRCEPNQTNYIWDTSWGVTGDYQYFKIIMKSQPEVWGDGVLKTSLTGMGVREQ